MTGDGAGLRLIHFSSDSFFSGVVDSQVLAPLRLLGERMPGMQRAALFLTSIRHWREERLKVREEEVRRALPGVAIQFKHRLMSFCPAQSRIWAGQLRRSIRAFGMDGKQPIIVHCRGESPAVPAALLKRRDPRIRVLLDVRGSSEDESGYAGWMRGYLTWRSRRRLAAAAAGADAVSAVSNRLMEHLRQMGLVSPRIPTSVVPCCVNTQAFYFSPNQRQSRRTELGLQDKFVVCYCGATGHWQRPDLVVEAFAAIRVAMPDAHLLVLTKEAPVFEEHLRSAGVDMRNVTFYAAPHSQVATYLMAADMGLLLRDDNLTNRVACPVKFSEYLRCGLPVLLTEYVGDAAELVKREELGGTVHLPMDREEVVQAARTIRQRLDAQGDSYRQRCSLLAERLLSWEGQVDKLIGVYQALARED